MTITKNFTQKHVAIDCEGRNWEWVDTDKTYEELVGSLKTEWYIDGVRTVEKTFHEDTFTITTKAIKTARSHWVNGKTEVTEE